MATVSSADVPRWVSYVQPAINAILVMIIAGLFATFLVANSAANGVANHEGRLSKVEEKLSKQDVLVERLDSAIQQIKDLKDTLHETNQRLDADRDRKRAGR